MAVASDLWASLNLNNGKATLHSSSPAGRTSAGARGFSLPGNGIGGKEGADTHRGWRSRAREGRQDAQRRTGMGGSDVHAGSRTHCGRKGVSHRHACFPRAGLMGNCAPSLRTGPRRLSCCSSAEPTLPKSPTVQHGCCTCHCAHIKAAERRRVERQRRGAQGPLRTAMGRCPMTLSVQRVAQSGQGSGDGICVVGVTCQLALLCNYGYWGEKPGFGVPS